MEHSATQGRRGRAGAWALRALLTATTCAALVPACASAEPALAYVTNQGSGVSVISIPEFVAVDTIAVGRDPRGIAVTPDGRWLLTANQGSADVSVVDRLARRETGRIPVGSNVEFLRVSPDGAYAFATYEPSSRGGPPTGSKKEKDDDGQVPAEVAVIDLKKGQVTGRMKASLETEGIEFSADQKSLVVTNEGDNTLGVYDLATLRLTRTINLSSSGARPRGIKISPQRDRYYVTLEDSQKVLVLDPEFKVQSTIATANGPYGVAVERRTQRLWVAASRGNVLQVFDVGSGRPLASIPVGKRCWHFSFTPDGAHVLLACGRSDQLMVIDADSFAVEKTVADLKMPWGVVVYPNADGSLDERRP